MNAYDFAVKKMDGSEISLGEYRGKVLLVVNTATACGFTPQYKELQALYEQYSSQGLEILDFPCNQFGEQAPGSDDEIHSYCTGRFGIDPDSLIEGIDVELLRKKFSYTWHE